MSPERDLPPRPARHVENYPVTVILNGTHADGSVLSTERALADQIGVIRPRRREPLQQPAGRGNHNGENHAALEWMG